MNKKDFYAFARVAVLLLATVMTTTTAWAKSNSVKYIDYDELGNKVERNSPDNTTVINSNNKPTDLSAGWYVVEGPVNYTSGIKLGDGEINIILSDGAELNVGTEENPISEKAIMESGGAVKVYIYAQGGNTGKLKAFGSDYGIHLPTGSLAIGGGDVTGIGGNYGINVTVDILIQGSAHVNGVGGEMGIFGDNDITIYGKSVATTTVEGTGGDYGIYAYRNLYAKAATLKAKADKNSALLSYFGNITLDGCDVTAEAKTESDNFGAIDAYNNLSIKNNVRTVVKASTADDLNYGIGSFDGLASIDLGGVYDIQVPAGKPLIGKLKTCSRTFTPGTPSTIMLPFSVNAGNFSDGKFYEFTGVAYNTATQQWEADMDEVTGNTTANTPYVFVPAEGETEVEFDFGSKKNWTDTSCTPTESGDWTFTGTYSPLTYGTDLTASYVYGFAGADQPAGKDAVVAGQFVRAGEGATIPAFRAYLKRDTELVAPQAASRSAAAVPDVIVVRLHKADGSVTAISGELKVEDNGAAADYYTIDGRRLGSKPAGKGLYIRNGKKIIVK